MITIKLILFSLSIALAWWCKKQIPRFALYISTQVYNDYNSLFTQSQKRNRFLIRKSNIQPKRTVFTNGFWLLFPCASLFCENISVALILICLYYLSVLDYCYYLTDIRYVALIFILSLYMSFNNFHQETMLFCCILFSLIHIVSYFVLRKEIFGNGDSLLIISLSPLFSLYEICLLLFLASISGIIFYLVYKLFTSRKLTKLPFIPFISSSTFLLLIDRM